MKILLISGHGAGDPGAGGCGYKEADLTRELVNLIAPKLRAYATVDIYDQSRNAFKDCKTGRFNIGKYDYVFEVHFNASNGAGKGTECFVTTMEKGIKVEQAVMRRMGQFFKLRDNDSIFDGVKRTNFLVIKTCKNRGMSGALLETCFIDNKDDMSVYASRKVEIATNITEGIAEGFGLKKSTSTTTPPSKPSKPSTPPKKSVDTIAREVIAGKWGNGEDRKKRLQNAGYNYAEVQKRVNELSGVKSTYYPKYTGNSYGVDTVLRAIGVESKFIGSWSKRKPVASANGISNYKGTATQNTKIISLAKQGKLKRV